MTKNENTITATSANVRYPPFINTVCQAWQTTPVKVLLGYGEAEAVPISAINMNIGSIIRFSIRTPQ